MGEIRKHPLNAKGKYYVDQDNCDICAACIYTAPDNFRLRNEDLYEFGAYVFKQPETLEEQDSCEEAVMCCPTEAILNNGEE